MVGVGPEVHGLLGGLGLEILVLRRLALEIWVLRLTHAWSPPRRPHHTAARRAPPARPRAPLPSPHPARRRRPARPAALGAGCRALRRSRRGRSEHRSGGNGGVS